MSADRVEARLRTGRLAPKDLAAISAETAMHLRFDDRLSENPGLRKRLRELAAEWIAKIEAKPNPTQSELRMIARAHIARGELPQAEETLRRALEMGGGLDGQLRTDLEDLIRLQ